MQCRSLDGGPHVIFMTSDNSSVDDSDCHYLPFVCEDTRFLVGKGTPSCLYPWQQGGKMNEDSGSWICCEVQPAGPTDFVLKIPLRIWIHGSNVLYLCLQGCILWKLHIQPHHPWLFTRTQKGKTLSLSSPKLGRDTCQPRACWKALESVAEGFSLPG